jgi:CheY-like chemotaxis protein
MMGGRITVESKRGQGSTFVVNIPTGDISGVPLIEPAERSPVAVVQKNAPQRATTQTTLHCRVLLAEDGRDNQRLITFLLEKAGAEVSVAENGQLAFEMALAAREAAQPFDVVLMDMQMPVLDGYGATAKLREAGYKRPIIALTAHAMSGDRDKCLAAGCDDYATKPINRVRLIELIAAHASTEGHDLTAAMTTAGA